MTITDYDDLPVLPTVDNEIDPDYFKVHINAQELHGRGCQDLSEMFDDGDGFNALMFDEVEENDANTYPLVVADFVLDSCVTRNDAANYFFAFVIGNKKLVSNILEENDLHTRNEWNTQFE